VISSNGVLQGVDLERGTVIWSLVVRGNRTASPTALGAAVVVGSSEASGNLLAVRTTDGEPEMRARRTAEGARPTGFGSPLVAAGRVFLVSKSGQLSVLALEGGKLLYDH